MKILFCIQMMVEMDQPWLYTNYLTNYFKRYITQLRQAEASVEIAILMGEAPAMIYEDMPEVQSYVISQRQMTRNGAYSHREIQREYFRYCHERGDAPDFLDYHVNLIRDCVDFVPDIVISRDNAPYLEVCFPEALTLYTEVGFVSRKPFGQTMYFDPVGMNCGSYLHRYWDRIEPDVEWNATDRKWICRLKEAVRSCIMKNNPYVELVAPWRRDFEKLYLLPLQFSGFSNVDAEIGFESQFDVLTHVFDSVPSDVGVVVTTHPDYNVLNAGTLKFLRRKYPNLLYSESFLDYNASSQYLLGLVDGVINLSSTVGLQTLFWDIPCLSVGKYFASYVSRPFSAHVEYQALSEKERERNDKVLLWLMTRYVVPASCLWNGKRFYDFLTRLYERYKRGNPWELYETFDSTKNLVEEMIRGLDENIPEPRGRLLEVVDEENIRNAEGKKKILVFGTGVVYRRNKKWLKSYSIAAFLDNDFRKQGRVLDGVRIVSPAEALDYRYDAILLLSDAHASMREQLTRLGIDAGCMYPADQLGKWMYLSDDRGDVRKAYEELERELAAVTRKKALLVSNQMDFTGAPIVLYYAAQLLKKNGFHVIVCSSKRGELEKRYEQEGIPFLFEPHLNQYNREFWNLADQCDFLFINTLLEKELIFGVRNTDTKCIWWIHESDERCGEADSERLTAAFGGNLSVYGVGRRVTDTLAAFKTWEGICVREFLYGIPDGNTCAEKERAEAERKISVCLVGSIYPVKGQDLFAKAVNLLPEETRDKCEFSLVGNILLEHYFGDVMGECPHLRYLGVKDREEMQHLYEDMDILVCPSRRDSMPVVTIEAMMNEKVVIASECTGIANYLEDGKNGFVFEKENVRELADKLAFAITNLPDLKAVKKAARKIYEENFSMETFERNLMNIVNKEPEGEA